MTPPRLAVYRHVVLPASETFVKDQVESFRRFDVQLYGIERDPGLTVAAPTFVLAESGGGPIAAARVAAFKARRRSGLLRREIGQFRPDLLLAHFAQDGWRIAPTAAALGVPLVVVCHGSDVLANDAYAATAERSMRQLVGHWTDLADASVVLVASSEFVADALVARGVPESKVLVRHPGVAVVPAAVGRTRSGVLSVGRLVENKGGADLLRAHASLSATHPGLRLTFAGDGPERPALEELTGTLGTAARVEFLGTQSPAQVRELMDTHSVLAAPSKPVANGASEGFGLVAVEAAMRGLPVVAYATGGIPEAVGEGEESGGALVAPGDVAALAEALRRVVDDPAFAAELGRRGRARAERMFEIDRCTAAVEDALLDILGRSR